MRDLPQFTDGLWHKVQEWGSAGGWTTNPGRSDWPGVQCALDVDLKQRIEAHDELLFHV